MISYAHALVCSYFIIIKWINPSWLSAVVLNAQLDWVCRICYYQWIWIDNLGRIPSGKIFHFLQSLSTITGDALFWVMKDTLNWICWNKLFRAYDTSCQFLASQNYASGFLKRLLLQTCNPFQTHLHFISVEHEQFCKLGAVTLFFQIIGEGLGIIKLL